TGTDTDHSNDTFLNSYIYAASAQINGGALSGGALQNGQVVAPFNAGRNGAGSDLNGDLIGDWGSTNSQVTNSNYMLARTNTLDGEPGGGTLGHAVDAQTWEFKVATFNFSATGVNAAAAAETQI